CVSNRCGLMKRLGNRAQFWIRYEQHKVCACRVEKARRTGVDPIGKAFPERYGTIGKRIACRVALGLLGEFLPTLLFDPYILEDLKTDAVAVSRFEKSHEKTGRLKRVTEVLTRCDSDAFSLCRFLAHCEP